MAQSLQNWRPRRAAFPLPPPESAWWTGEQAIHNSQWSPCCAWRLAVFPGSLGLLRPVSAHCARPSCAPRHCHPLKQFPLKSCGFPGAETARKRFLLWKMGFSSAKIAPAPRRTRRRGRLKRERASFHNSQWSSCIFAPALNSAWSYHCARKLACGTPCFIGLTPRCFVPQFAIVALLRCCLQVSFAHWTSASPVSATGGGEAPSLSRSPRGF